MRFDLIIELYKKSNIFIYQERFVNLKDQLLIFLGAYMTQQKWNVFSTKIRLSKWLPSYSMLISEMQNFSFKLVIKWSNMSI